MSVRDHTEEGLNRDDPAGMDVPGPGKRANLADVDAVSKEADPPK